MTTLGPCPSCGSTPPSGYGHACVPKPQPAYLPPPGFKQPNEPRACGCTRPCRCAVPPKRPARTICADCRWYRPETRLVWMTTPDWPATCLHENARDLVTGRPTDCRSRNNGDCPDFEAKP